MFSVPILLALIVGSLIILSFVSFIVRKRKALKLEKIEDTADNCEVINSQKDNKNCWCCEYDLSKDQKMEIFEKYGSQLCGKDSTTIINNKIDSSVAEKFNAHDTLTRAN